MQAVGATTLSSKAKQATMSALPNLLFLHFPTILFHTLPPETLPKLSILEEHKIMKCTAAT